MPTPTRSTQEEPPRSVRKHWPGVYVRIARGAGRVPGVRALRHHDGQRQPDAGHADRYLDSFGAGVAGLGIAGAARHAVERRRGLPGAVRKLPINTFFRAGGRRIRRGWAGSLASQPVTFDMGGTSTDVCLIRDGEPAQKSERQMGGFPVHAARSTSTP
jgi:N-methylhydantoinase A